MLLFVGGSFVIVLLDDEDDDVVEGNSFQGEAEELILDAMAITAPLAIGTAVLTAVMLSRRSVRPLEDAIRAARETTAHDLRRRLPLPGSDDEVRDLVVELNQLFARLDEGFGALSRFAADASHELRTPLAVIATDLEVTLRHPRTNDELLASIRQGLDEARRLSAVVDSMLTLARVGADAPDSRTEVDLLECVDGVLAQLGGAADAAGVTLVGPEDHAGATIIGNAVMLETAIRNLVANAIAAVPRGGRVHVTLEKRANDIAVVVDDNGPGVDGDPEKLFIPFHRGLTDRDDRVRGTGLGLTIARRVARAHDGTLDAWPSPLGGARFTLTVPRA
jgi:signal transduction histidine kinase